MSLPSTTSVPVLTEPNEHAMSLLLEAFLAEDTATALDALMPQVADHLAECLDCQWQAEQLLSALDDSVMLPLATLVALSETTAQVTLTVDAIHDAPSDEALTNYAFTYLIQGLSSAKRDFPEVAAHVAQCSACQQTLAQALAGAVRLAERRLPFAAPARLSIWETLGAQIRRLMAPYEVWVRRASVHITSVLAEPHIATEFVAQGVALRDRPHGHGATTLREQQSPEYIPASDTPVRSEQREESFTVDLREANEVPWLRARLHLRAGHSLRVTGLLTMMEVSAKERSGEPVPQLSWQILAQDTAAPLSAAPLHAEALGGTQHGDASVPTKYARITAEGVTDQQGQARFRLKRDQAYMLEFVVGEREWQIPLAIRTDPDDEER